MIHLTDISKSFGTQVLLAGAGLHVKPGMRVGLVGPNGAGKTTLLRLIVGEMSLDGGEISSRKDLRIGFLPQEIEEIAAHAVIDEVLASHAEVLTAERRIAELGQEIGRAYAEEKVEGKSDGGQRADPDELLHELGALQTAFEAARGYELEIQAQTILRGMGFKDTDFNRPIAELSGGWRMRAALSRLLLEQPDLLLMDEPTNHLDLESLIWLEEFLLTWPGSLIIISHDRYFLNRMATHIADLDRGIIDLYAGDYNHYEEEKKQRYEALVNAAKNQQREIESAEAFIRRFRAKNTKAKQVQQKIRQLERTELIDAPALERKTIKFRFPQPPRTGRVVAEVKHVRKAYGENVVYKRLDLVLERGEKVALVGPNGAGKSTLLKLLAGVVEPDEGSVVLGYNVRREYFAQHQLEVFHPDLTVLRTMEEAAGPAGRMAEVRSYLGAFLFEEDDVAKKVGVLSGGEKARLALALMLIDPAGLLLLDEPTNHLDMDSRAVLTEALRQFEGSVVFISHDRHLINAIGSKVIEVRDGRLTHYPGDWEYYQWKRGQETGSVLTPTIVTPAVPAAAVADVPKTHTVELGYKERKELSSRCRKVERRILAGEERQKELAALMCDPVHASDYELLSSASTEAEELADEIALLYEEWGSLSEALGTTLG
ncbi:MAG: ABC-F family ATP-binding cassette domain-containing protein [Actinobacteria bacterium]|jgi:ATP-binding cassette subfamily F protein 3|nr:ABC-F family ATP-binding cassette domain-containing protein [Actinomycetota bacterium]